MMTPTEAFKLLWERIYNPRNACPDVELATIQNAMAAILKEADRRPISERAKELLAHITLEPRTPEHLNYMWVDQHQGESWYELDSEAFDSLVRDLRNEVGMLLSELEGFGAIQLHDGKWCVK
jgi:hypothetical protein